MTWMIWMIWMDDARREGCRHSSTRLTTTHTDRFVFVLQTIDRVVERTDVETDGRALYTHTRTRRNDPIRDRGGTLTIRFVGVGKNATGESQTEIATTKTIGNEWLS